MTFQSGHKLSPGRQLGSRNKRNAEIFHRLESRGDTDPADLLSSIVTNNQEPNELRIQAAGLLMPYKYGKHGSIPPARYVELEIDVNEFTHVSDAEAFLARIALLTARGHLDIQSAQELSGLVKAWIDTQYAKDELNFKISPPETRDTTIRIVGGLPELPGTNITMRVLNGNAVSEQLLTAPKDVIPPDDSTNQVPETTATEFTPGQLKAEGPHPLQRHHFEEPRTNSTNGNWLYVLGFIGKFALRLRGGMRGRACPAYPI
jgi:hypothetical protein